MTATTDSTSRSDTPSVHADGAGSRRTGEVTLVSAFGALWTLAALFLLADVRGAVLGGLVAFVWLWESGWAAFAIGHLGVLPFVGADVVLLEFVPVEVGLLLVLFGSLVSVTAPYRTLAVGLLAFAGLGGLALGTLELTGWPLAAAVVLVGVGSAASFLAHRYERVRLGLVSGESS